MFYANLPSVFVNVLGGDSPPFHPPPLARALRAAHKIPIHLLKCIGHSTTYQLVMITEKWFCKNEITRSVHLPADCQSQVISWLAVNALKVCESQKYSSKFKTNFIL